MADWCAWSDQDSNRELRQDILAGSSNFKGNRCGDQFRFRLGSGLGLGLELGDNRVRLGGWVIQ